MNSFLRHKIGVILTGTILIILALEIFHAYSQSILPRLTELSIRDATGISTPIQLPLNRKTPTTLEKYQITGVLEISALSASTIQLIVDDCIRSITINGHLLTQEELSGDHACIARKPLIVHLQPYIHVGRNPITFVLENLIGSYSFNMTHFPFIFKTPTTLGLMLICCILLFGGIGLLLRQQTHDFRLNKAFIPITLLLTFAVGIRYFFIFQFHSPENYIFSDMSGYVSSGNDIVNHIFNTTQIFQSITYPLLLAESFKNSTAPFNLICWLHFCASIGSILLAWRASIRILGHRSALWVLVLLSIHIPMIILSGFILTETIFTFGISILYYLISKLSPAGERTWLYAMIGFISSY